MVWGIIGALDAEVALLVNQMNVSGQKELCGCTYYTGKIDKTDVVVVCCSIGKINAAVCANNLILEFGADLVVNVGIAGNTDKQLGILDVVISSDVVCHDTDLELMERYYPYRRTYMADAGLIEKCKLACRNIKDRNFNYKVGRIASGDIFVSDSVTKNDIISRLAPSCVEMEGASIGQVAFMHGKPFLIIRTMSDTADESADNLYDNFMELAATNSASILLGMISSTEK